MTACAENRVAAPLRPDLTYPERFDCREIEGGRPSLPSEYVIDWGRVTTVQQAREQHQAFVAQLRVRERVITGYLLALEGRVFACSDDARWLRDFFSALPAPEASE